MIRLERIYQKNPEEIIDDVKSGKIHVVCMARNGLTHLNVYAVLFCGLTVGGMKSVGIAVYFSGLLNRTLT